MKRSIRYIYLSIIVVLLNLNLFAQPGDSLQVVRQLAEAERLIIKDASPKALVKLDSAYLIASRNFWTELKGRAAFLYGQMYAVRDQFEVSVEYFHKALLIYKTIGKTEQQAATNIQMAQLFTEKGYLEKGLQAYQDVAALKAKMNSPITAKYWELMASLSLSLGDTSQGEEYLGKAIDQAEGAGEQARLAFTLAKVYVEQDKVDQAMALINEALVNQSKLAVIMQVNLLNAKAVLLKRSGDTQNSGKYFDRALQLAQQTQGQDLLKGTLLTNIGIAQTNLENYSQAHHYYNDALSLWKETKDTEREAKAYAFIAANYYLRGNLDKARNNAQTSIDIALPNNYYQTLAEGYRVMSLIAISEKEADTYLKQELEALAKAAATKQESHEALLAKELAFENIEAEIAKQVAEQLETERKMQQLALESENRKKDIALKANELALLKREKELRDIELRNKRLESQRANQLLSITKANALAEELKRKEEIQKLLIAKQESERKEREQTIQLLEKTQILNERQLTEEANVRKYGLAGIFLILIILVIVAFSAIMSRRAAKRLRAQKEQIEEQSVKLQSAHKEILTQNEELTQFQEELTVQRNNLAEHNVLLDRQNSKVEQSIRSATIIQNAILPPPHQMAALLSDYFVLFRPRDIVSGDFYWMAQIHGKRFVAAVDCTGHGVPGALMSLVANSILNKIIKVNANTDPGSILTEMHEEVFIELKQESDGNSYGVDMALVALSGHGDTVLVEFAGAKRPLHYAEKGSNELQKLKGDRISIGGRTRKKRVFTTQTLQLPVGSSLYVSSDGFPDQNNKDRTRYGSKEFHALIERVVNLPMDEQQKKMNEALDKHMLDTEQRDDILVVGFKI